MKKFLVLTLFFLFACKKQIDVPVENIEQLQRVSQTSFFYCGADAGARGDIGLSAEADVVKFGGGSFYMRSWWIAFYFTDTAGKTKWTQWGYGTNKSLGNITIIAHWDYSVNTFYYPPTIHLNTVPLNYGGRSVFSIYNIAGTTKWRYARDGIDIEEIDLGTTSIDRVQVKIESQSSSPGKWAGAVNVKNFSTLKPEGWVLVPHAQFGGNYNSSTGLSIWPIEGRNQNSNLQIAELNMGGGNPIPYTSALW